MYEEFLNKKVYLITKENRTYSGIVIRVSDDGITIDDIKIGSVYFSTENIKHMERYNPNKKKWRDNNG